MYVLICQIFVFMPGNKRIEKVGSTNTYKIFNAFRLLIHIFLTHVPGACSECHMKIKQFHVKKTYPPLPFAHLAHKTT